MGTPTNEERILALETALLALIITLQKNGISIRGEYMSQLNYMKGVEPYSYYKDAIDEIERLISPLPTTHLKPIK